MSRPLPQFMKSPGRKASNQTSGQGRPYQGRNQFRRTTPRKQPRQGSRVTIVTFSIIEMDPGTRIGVKVIPPQSNILKIVKV